jgi:hypothetical protein
MSRPDHELITPEEMTPDIGPVDTEVAAELKSAMERVAQRLQHFTDGMDPQEFID